MFNQLSAGVFFINRFQKTPLVLFGERRWKRIASTNVMNGIITGCLGFYPLQQSFEKDH
jgi:hypothetical protein